MDLIKKNLKSVLTGFLISLELEAENPIVTNVENRRSLLLVFLIPNFPGRF